MKIRLRTLAIILAVISITSISGVIALTSWNGGATWSGLGTKTFEIYNVATGGVKLDSPYTLPSVAFGVNTYTFYIENTGNVPITVSVTGATTVGCAASWTNSGIYTVPVGATRTVATLTLTVTADSGSYSWAFSVS